MQCVITLYLKDKADGEMKEFTAHTRDDVMDQLLFIKKRFLTYADFGKASFDKFFTPEKIKKSIKYTANYLTSSFVRNNGNGHYSLEPLPAMAQLTALNNMVAGDLDTTETWTFASTRMILEPTLQMGVTMR